MTQVDADVTGPQNCYAQKHPDRTAADPQQVGEQQGQEERQSHPGKALGPGHGAPSPAMIRSAAWAEVKAVVSSLYVVSPLYNGR